MTTPNLYNIERTDHEAISLHNDASMSKAAAVLTQAAHDEQQVTQVNADDFNCRPWDVAAAFARAAVTVLGQPLKGKAVPSMFGTIQPGMHSFPVQTLVYDTPMGQIDQPRLYAMKTQAIVHLAVESGIDIPSPWSEHDRESIIDALEEHFEIVGVGTEDIKVPFGNVKLSFNGVEIGMANIGGFEHPDLGVLGRLMIEVQNKNVRIAEALIAETKKVLKRRSIYRGRAIDSADDRPSFWDPFTVDPNSVVLSEENLRAIQTNIMYPIHWRERALERDPRLLKRTFIWSGEYGTGKSMTMILMAQWAVKNGWTVIRHKAGSDDLSKTMQLARILEPCLVLVEDAEVFARSSDKETVSKLLDDFDGMLSKSGQVITILTTNHEDEITKGMTRPGRIDGLMRFTTLDRPGVQQLFINMLGIHTIERPIPSELFNVTEKSKDFKPLPIDWDAVYESVKHYTGAFMAEVVKRVNLQLLDRVTPIAQTEDLLRAAESLHTQYEVYCKAGEPEHRNALDEALNEIMESAVTGLQLDRNTLTFVRPDED